MKRLVCVYMDDEVVELIDRMIRVMDHEHILKYLGYKDKKPRLSRGDVIHYCVKKIYENEVLPLYRSL